MAIITGDDGPNNISGTAGNDSIDAKLGDDVITTNSGQDGVDGGGGDDTLRIDWSDETRDVFIEIGRALPGTRAWVNTHTAWADSTRKVQHNGIEHYDVMSGSGNDSLNGWADLWDKFDGGAGIDVWLDSFAGLTAGMSVNMAAVSTAAGQAFADGTEVRNIETARLTLTQGNDRFRDFGVYNDSIATGDGDDHVHFAGGNDYANGGGGDDVLHVDYSDAANAVYVSNQRGLPGTRVFENTHTGWSDSGRSVLHNDFDHYDIRSGAGDDELAGWTNAWDRFDGGDGVDLWRDSFFGGGSGVAINLAKMATARGQKLADGTRISNVERAQLTLTEHDDRFRDQGDHSDSVSSGAGDDVLQFSGGDDYANGGDGDDILKIDWSHVSGSVITSTSRGLPGTRSYVDTGGGWGGASDRVLHNGIEHYDVRGGSGDDAFWGWSNSWDRFDGGAGVDTWHDRFDLSGVGLDISMGRAQKAAGLKLADGSRISKVEAADLTLTDQADSFRDKGAFSDAVRALGGNDTITSSNGRDYANGGDGTDTLMLAWGNARNDIVVINWFSHYAWENTDTVYADSSRVVEFAEIERISARLGRGDDLVSVADGNDFISSGGGNDDLILRGGRDRALGGNGDDVLRGGDGRDILNGQNGRDDLQGDAGADRLGGGGGSDRLTGGDGNDVLTGGRAGDRFVFLDLAEGRDLIRDFQDGRDIIDLSGLGLGFGDLDIVRYDDAASTRISFGSTTIRLEGVERALIDAGDFDFV